MRSFKSGALFHFWTTSLADFVGHSSSCDPETIDMLLYSTLSNPGTIDVSHSRLAETALEHFFKRSRDI